jgi:hypothetical protein
MPNGAEHSVMVETFQPFQGGQHSAFLVLQGLRGGQFGLAKPIDRLTHSAVAVATTLPQGHNPGAPQKLCKVPIKKPLLRAVTVFCLEARPRVELGSTDLQSVA